MTIIFNDEKLIFCKGTKNAGTSFEIALSKYCDNKDVIGWIEKEDEVLRKKLGYRSPQNNLYSKAELFKKSKKKFLLSFNDKRIKHKFTNHMSLSLIREELGIENFNSFKTLAIVRNPYDYVVSYYFYSIKERNHDYTLSEWIELNPQVLTMYKKLYFIDNKDAVDFYIRYENFKEDIDRLSMEHKFLYNLYDTFSKIKTKHNIKPNNIDSIEMIRKSKGLKEVINFYFEYYFSKFDYKKI